MAHCSHSPHVYWSAGVSRAKVKALLFSNMAERTRNPEWKEDADLKQDLETYVLQNLSRQEILDFVSRDYAQYAWSLGTLSRRLAFFNIKYVNYDTDMNDVKEAVQKELEGPGQFLGYRCMQRKVREQHKLAVPRNLVYDMMAQLDQDGLERRGGVGKKKRKRGNAGTFTSMVGNLCIKAALICSVFFSN